MTTYSGNRLLPILTIQSLYIMSVSNETPTNVATVKLTSKNPGATPNYSAKCKDTKECVKAESNRHLADVFETEMIFSTTSSEAGASL